MKKLFQLVGLLVVAMALSISAQATYFTDITDPNLAMDVEVLRLMEVAGGYSDNTYRPTASLTRAQFSKMVVSAMDMTNQLGQYATYTVFPDVRPSYWAASYINLASRGLGVVGGFADGNFRPESTITGGQAVTILMRLLGYTDADVGAVWPDGYMYQAQSIGLLDGLTLEGNSPINRGETASLMVNFLGCDTKDGGAFATSVAASALSDVVIVSANAQASDGTWGAVELSDGTTYKMANDSSSGQLNGYRGTLLLDKNGKVMTFLPEGDTTSKTITVKKATATTVQDTNNQSYTITATTAVYRNGTQTDWADTFGWVNSGTAITLHFHQSGAVSHVFVGSGVSATTAVVVGTTGSTVGFEAMAGSNKYTMYKNGILATASDLREHDVATYDGATNAIRVSDLRLTGHFESAYPNTSGASEITVLGHTFTVLPSAQESISQLKLATNITLLLTEDLQVAGAVEALGGNASGNAVGLVESVSTSSATVQLLCGLTVEGTVSYSETQVDALQGQLVKVSSSGAGKISLSRLSNTSRGDFDVFAGTVGSAKLASNVRIYETVAGGALRAIDLEEIPGGLVRESKITYVGKDWRGDVNILVLNDVTGNNYIYGLAQVSSTSTPVYDENQEQTGTKTTYQLSVTNGETMVGPFKRPTASYGGQFIGIAPSVNGEQVANVVVLKELKDVPNSAWLDETTVVYGGATYRVADGVTAYNDDIRSWMSLSQARAYANEATLYVDDHNVVRVLEIG